MGPEGSVRGSPAPVGSTSSVFSTRSLASAHRPSGESDWAMPLPRRTAGDLSMPRRYTA